MDGFDPRDWWGWPDGADRGHPQGDPDLYRLLLFGLTAAACLCLASFAPPALVPFVAAQLFVIAALGSALEAVLREERLIEAHLTAWDQAAALMLLAQLLRLAFRVPPQLLPEGTVGS
ncbi:MAG TPA: hypothetical protein VD970_09825 [Acetobacteraceae bacterium]|nr:hypothetical protein [Acetobacteraceae bacterium]